MQELNFDNDPDHFAMSIDRRTALEQLRDWVKSKLPVKNQADQSTSKRKVLEIITEE